MAYITLEGAPITGKSTASSNPIFQPIALFGGAITASLPFNFFDASTIREVPDNQEVYIDRDGFTSIVIDLGERVATDNVRTDDQAFAFHIEDVADPNDRLCVGGLHHMVSPHLPSAPTYYTIATTKPVKTPPTTTTGDENMVKFTAMFISLVRLEEKKTDILVTVNVPYEGLAPEANLWEGHVEVWPAVLNNGYKIMQTTLESFQIIDCNLFGED